MSALLATYLPINKGCFWAHSMKLYNGKIASKLG